MSGGEVTAGARTLDGSNAVDRAPLPWWNLGRLWFPALALVLGLYAGLPWLAPVFMRLGWEPAGRVLYAVYSTQCHQMAQRSFFLFGPKLMYSMDELARVGVASDPLALRAFVGTPALGWKVAWSDRMAAMYIGLFFFAVLLRRLGPRARPLPLWAGALLLAPLALDGTTHLLSDLSPLGQGFRDQNSWLAALTGNTLPSSFYVGDALGSFNSWMRLLSGALFGLGIAWAAVPSLARSFGPARSGPPTAIGLMALSTLPANQTMLAVPDPSSTVRNSAPFQTDRR